jgi:hypothetical protein
VTKPAGSSRRQLPPPPLLPPPRAPAALRLCFGPRPGPAAPGLGCRAGCAAARRGAASLSVPQLPAAPVGAVLGVHDKVAAQHAQLGNRGGGGRANAGGAVAATPPSMRAVWQEWPAARGARPPDWPRAGARPAKEGGRAHLGGQAAEGLEVFRRDLPAKHVKVGADAVGVHRLWQHACAALDRPADEDLAGAGEGAGAGAGTGTGAGAGAETGTGTGTGTGKPQEQKVGGKIPSKGEGGGAKPKKGARSQVAPEPLPESVPEGGQVSIPNCPLNISFPWVRHFSKSAESSFEKRAIFPNAWSSQRA